MSKTRQNRNATRRGYLYLSVLFVSLIVSVSGLAAISILHTSRRSAIDGADWLRARNLADSAVAYGVSQVNNTSSWRTTFIHGVESTGVTVSGGTMSFRIEDQDGALDDDPFDSAYMFGIGKSGQATFVRRVEIEPAGDGIDVLDGTLAVDGDFAPTATVAWTVNKEIYVGGSVDIANPISLISGDIRAAGTIAKHNSYIYGSYTAGNPSRTFPGSNWPAYYESEGTSIDVDSLPSSGGYRRIENTVLHAGDNPFGAENLLGIYIIDCDGEDLRISNCRIAATVLIKNPGPNSIIYGKVYWEPHLANFPTLLVQGDFTIEHDPAPLLEAAINTNLNPAALPFFSLPDSGLLDELPSRIRGLIYVDGQLSIVPFNGSRMEVEGCVICKTLVISAHAQIVHRPEYKLDPPPGFRDDSKMQIISNSWRRVASN